jgi:hypothetical protein
MNAHNEKVVLVHDLDNNTYLQTLKNYYIINPKAYNILSNINH